MLILVPEAQALAFVTAVPALSLGEGGTPPMANLDWPAVQLTDGVNLYRGWCHPWNEVDGEWALHQGAAYGMTVWADTVAAGVRSVDSA